MNNNKIMEALVNFRKEIDEAFIGKTPVPEEDEIDKNYDVDIYIFRHPGMGNSKQVIVGNAKSIYVATASYLETLLRQGLISEQDLKELVKLAIKGANNKL